jgi:ATP-binding cassette subfamily B protein
VSAFRVAWRVAHHRPKLFWFAWALWASFFSLPALSGWVLSRAFAALDRGATGDVYWWVVAMVATEALRMAVVHAGVAAYHRVWVHQQAFLQANMLAAQLESGGPTAGRPVASPGEAVTHFRDDVTDVVQFVDNLVDASGGLTFFGVAIAILGYTNLPAALVLVLPLAVVALVTARLGATLKRLRSADREATASVTGLLGDTMSAATTVKVNRAENRVIDRLALLTERRRATAVRDRVLDEGIMAVSNGSTDVGLGLVLVAGAGAIASGSFGVAELALFVAYLSWLNFLPRMVGRVLASARQSAVGIERMAALVAGGAAGLVAPRDVPIGVRERRPRPTATRPSRVALDELSVERLTARFPEGGGVSDVSFVLRRGEFVVVTGTIGSGKTTLMRALLGLAWQTTEPGVEASGVVRWNGEVVADRAAFLVPPNAAFLPQVPQLVSDSLADNVAFGDADTPDGEAQLAWALGLAELDADVAAFPAGTATMIGPRGLRLSGGQRQRLAAARAVFHRPELVVLDDLSSALDVETELRLWEHFAAAGMTVLAVSHRAVAFEAATHVLRLDNGRLV